MAISQKLPVPSSKLFVWAFIPYRITEQGLVSDYDDKRDYQDLANVFAELGLAWKWQPITLKNMHTVVEEVAASSNEYIPVVLNYCDGSEIDGYPGGSVIKLLEAKGIIFTGTDSNCYHLTTSKILMKRAFIKAGVATASYEVISDINHVEGVCDRVGTPAIVKPVTNLGGSSGIYLKSVVFNDEQARVQVQQLPQRLHDVKFLQDSIFVEQFINGSEFTVFLLGSANQPESIKIYPPVERVFHSSLPETEQFLAYELYWTKDGEESSLPPSEPFCRYQLVTPPLHDKLCELSKRAYCAVGGNGYARVDIRMDKTSQQLFVLEVNANCGISSQHLSTFDDNDLGATSVGTILHLARIPFAQLMSELIVEAFARHSTKLPLVSQAV